MEGFADGESRPTVMVGWSRRAGALANFVADPTALASRLALETGQDVPRLAHVLEALQEGFDSLRRYLDDEVHGWPPVMLLRRVYPS
jgi:hypothetical protein